MISIWQKLLMVPEWALGVMTARMRCISGQDHFSWDDQLFLQATYPGDWWDVMETAKILSFDD